MYLSPGTRLGPYEIIAAIGSGAMGDVYRARDVRLERVVAIKVAKEQFSERFEREARAIAALNHPNICQIYDVGPNFLVMEYVDGTPLGRITSHERLLEIGAQIADGLRAAHAAGIVHRDLKPANIFLSRDGNVKILDFGLARMETASHDVTAPAGITNVGTAVGTVAYMSPEQARGETVDARSDLWSLGVVLYEAATGIRPFDGPTVALVFEALLTRPLPPVREQNPRLPLEIAQIIDRLLEKDRETRYQSAADVRAALKRAERSGGASVAAREVIQERRSGWRPVRAVTVIVVAVAVIAAGSTWFLTSRPPAASRSEYVQLTNFADSATAPALSPDGRMVTFIRGGGFFWSHGQIYSKLLPNGESVQLTNHPAPKLAPVFTSDGTRVAYTLIDRSATAAMWNTWTVPVHGGQPALLLPNATGLTWLDDRRVVYSEIKLPGIHMGVVTSEESRANRREIYFPAHERAMAHYSWASPDRKSVLLVEMDRTGTWQRCRLVPFDGGSQGRQVGPEGQCIAAGWSPDGTWMYFNAEVASSFHLWRQRFPDGPPEQLTFGPTEEEGLAVAPDGKSLITSVGIRRRSIWLHDATGARPLLSEGFTFAPKLSNNARRLFYLMKQDSTSPVELWSRDIASGKTERLLSGFSISQFDVSSDEKEVAFTVTSSGAEPQIWLAPLDRRAPPRLVVDSADEVSFGTDGYLFFRALGTTSNSLDRIKADGSGRERISSPILNKIATSPDAEWVVAMAATQSESSPHTVALPVRGGPPRKVCTVPCLVNWSADGKFFFVTIQQNPGGSPMGVAGTTFAIPLPAGSLFVELPAELDSTWKRPPGTRAIPESPITPGLTPDTYVFVRTDPQRNLFRIPLR